MEGRSLKGKSSTQGKRVARHLQLGRAGEEAVARYLAGQGWSLLARNWRPSGQQQWLELDIVACDGDTLVFVEVKTRSRTAENAARQEKAPYKERLVGIPAHAAFSPTKQSRLLKAAGLFLSEKGFWHLPCRIDLACAEQDAEDGLRLEYYTNVIEFGNPLDSGDADWQPW